MHTLFGYCTRRTALLRIKRLLTDGFGYWCWTCLGGRVSVGEGLRRRRFECGRKRAVVRQPHGEDTFFVLVLVILFCVCFCIICFLSILVFLVFVFVFISVSYFCLFICLSFFFPLAVDGFNVFVAVFLPTTIDTRFGSSPWLGRRLLPSGEACCENLARLLAVWR